MLLKGLYGHLELVIMFYFILNLILFYWTTWCFIKMIKELKFFLRNRETKRDEFIFYSKRLMRLLFEFALSLLPHDDHVVDTPQNTKYQGRKFKGAGVSTHHSRILFISFEIQTFPTLWNVTINSILWGIGFPVYSAGLFLSTVYRVWRIQDHLDERFTCADLCTFVISLSQWK